jgi:hypothetical protein
VISGNDWLVRLLTVVFKTLGALMGYVHNYIPIEWVFYQKC